MAIEKDKPIIYTDLKSKYDSFNTFITNYGGSIAKLTVPANSPHLVDDADINNLNGKINEFKADTYLKTQTSWWVNKTVSAGALAYASDWTNINTTITNFAKVKCRNQGTNSYTFKTNNCTQGTKNHNCSDGKNTHNCSDGKHTHNCSDGKHTHNCSDGKHTHNCSDGKHTHNCSDGKHSHNCSDGKNTHNCSDGKHSHNCNPDGTHGNKCSNGACSNVSGATVGGTSGWTGCYATCTGLAGFSVATYANGCNYRVSITYNTATSSCSSLEGRAITFKLTGNLDGRDYRNIGASGATLNACGTQAWQDWSSKFTGTTTLTATACTYGTRSVDCSNGNRNVACSNGTRNVSCQNGTRNVGCSNVTRNVSCQNTTRNVGCSYTTRTVSCSHTTRNVGCQNVTRTVSCQNTTRNVSCGAHLSNTITCQNVRNSNTTFIDITCNHTSRTHG